MSTNNEGKWSGTFQWWDKYPPSEIKVLVREDLSFDYESSYTHQFNYVREKGWVREDKHWLSPDRTRRFKKVEDAYNYQRYFIEVLNG